MTPKTLSYWLPLAGLIGLGIAHACLAATVLSLAASSPLLAPALANFSTIRWLYLGFSLLFAAWGAVSPLSLGVTAPAALLLIFLFAGSISIMILSVLVVLVLMIGLNQNLFPGLINWMLVSGFFVAPIMLANAGVVLFVAAVAESLKQYKLLKKWEIGALLSLASWFGLTIGWSL